MQPRICRQEQLQHLHRLPSISAEVNIAVIEIRFVMLIHVGWGMAGVKQTYNLWERAGDQYCGRLLAGNDVCSPLFALLPPRFPDASPTVQSAVEATYPTLIARGLHLLANHLLVSLIYHQQWIRDTLPENHPLFATALFQSDPSLIAQLAAQVQCRLARPEDSVKATGQ